MKKNLEILDFEDKKTKAGKRYTRFKTSDGWMSCFDAKTIEEAKKFEGKIASCEVSQAGEFQNIKECYGEEENLDKAEVEVEKVERTSQSGLKSQNAMFVSYAKDLILAGKSCEEAVKIIQDLKEAFE